ncbi:MAG: DUF2892 domain-containing protein [Lysinibacillus sp.]
MPQVNLSERNAFCRFMIGTTLTAFGIAKVSRNPDCMRGRFMIYCGAMKMAEGVTKFCPLKAMMNSNMQSAMSCTMQSMLSEKSSMSSEEISKLMKDFSAIFSSDDKATTSTTDHKQNTSDNNNSTNKAQNPS